METERKAPLVRIRSHHLTPVCHSHVGWTIVSRYSQYLLTTSFYLWLPSSIFSLSCTSHFIFLSGYYHCWFVCAVAALWKFIFGWLSVLKFSPVYTLLVCRCTDSASEYSRKGVCFASSPPRLISSTVYSSWALSGTSPEHRARYCSGLLLVFSPFLLQPLHVSGSSVV